MLHGQILPFNRCRPWRFVGALGYLSFGDVSKLGTTPISWDWHSSILAGTPNTDVGSQIVRQTDICAGQSFCLISRYSIWHVIVNFKVILLASCAMWIHVILLLFGSWWWFGLEDGVSFFQPGATRTRKRAGGARKLRYTEGWVEQHVWSTEMTR